MVTAALPSSASAINGGYDVPAQSAQVSFTAAILADSGLNDGDPSAPWGPDGAGPGEPGGGVRLLCGATLVNRSWVLTAKHCVQGGLVVRLDSVNSLSGGALHRVVATEPYPDHDGIAVDAALLKIDPPAPSNGIELASPAELPMGQAVGLLGWGMSAPDSGTSPVLRQVDIQVVGGEACGGLRPAEICLADPANPNASACFGDSGGPAVIRRGEAYVLAGVASQAGGTAPTCSGATVYVGVPSVSDWVMSVTSAQK